MNGYEYEQVGRCKKTGKAYVSPVAWTGAAAPKGAPGQSKPDSVARMPRPVYSTCACCPNKVSGDSRMASE
jgi:hypothetical protein